MATITAARVAADDLAKGDVFIYSGVEVEVSEVIAIDGRIVEVVAHDTFEQRIRYIDFGVTEEVEVVRGPSAEQAAAAVVVEAARPLATPLALAHVGGKALRSLPASAALVLYALAAVQDSGVATPSTAQVAHAAGLADSTAAGHLRSLVAKGAVGARSLGWVVL